MTSALGLRENVLALDGLADRPTAAQVMARAEIWRPYRTVATWYLWRGANVTKTTKPVRRNPRAGTRA
jgi:3-methyladenine DNA glycosylase/8-oxoguanine DNA glycosylase